MTTPFEQIPKHTPQSIQEAIFYEWRAKRLTDSEYHVAAAKRAAETAESYTPRVIPPIPLDVAVYVGKRLASFSPIPRDPDLARKNGAWLHLVREALADNLHDYRFLIWCQEKLVEAGVDQFKVELDRLDNQAFKFVGLTPPKQFEHACRVQELDREERIRKERD